MTDIAYTEDEFKTYWNGSGDIATVEGTDDIEQQIITAVVENVGLSAPSPTATAIEEQRSEIETVVKNVAVTREPISVFVTDSPLQGGSDDSEVLAVQYEIQTGRTTASLTTET